MLELIREILPIFDRPFEDPDESYVPYGVVIVVSVAFTLMWTYLVAVNLYQIAIGFFGLRRRVEYKFLEPLRTFAIIVPAHDEEAVIAETVRSLRAVDYPPQMYEIFVVADNCTDATAERAKEAGATVLERTSVERRGKPYAFEWAFEQIEASGKQFDGIVTIDADNVVSPNLLSEFNSRLLQGQRVIQAYLDTKNPDDTWITKAYAFAFWLAARQYQLARYQVGLPVALGGTGFCIETKLLRDHGWDVTALTDDLEYTMRVLLNGVVPTWAHDAVIYDEKPLTMRASLRQRLRWMQGHWDVAFRYFWPLLRKGVRERNMAALDGAIYCASPTRVVLWSLTIAFAWLPWFFPIVTLPLDPGLWLGLLVIAFYVLHPLLYLVLEKVPPLDLLRYVVFMPIFALTWIPVTWLGYLRRKFKHWDKTQHTRALSIDEVEASRRPGLR